MFPFQQIIDKYYPAETPLRDIYMRHCSSVSHKAQQLARKHNLQLDPDEINAAAMLHDIGIFLTDAAGIQCFGTEPYLAHGRLGADLLRKEGAPEYLARVAERHTGTGLTPADVSRLGGILTADRDYMPRTQLERLVCYADKFYSKNGDMKEKSLDRVLASIAKFGPEAVERVNSMHNELG